MLLTRDRVDQELFDTFLTRRMPRVRAVVEGSMQLVTWQLEHSSDADVPGLQLGCTARSPGRPDARRRRSPPTLAGGPQATSLGPLW
ncbi:MAG TPA: hypothetical protein VHS32_29200 [Streptosporangiaceae bacterium]|nr:hypothetical protein [Streptosporangiaceae bacterium]